MSPNNINAFSNHLFWDTDRSKLDWENHKEYIIKQVLEYGLMEDWKRLKEIYGLETIAEVARGFREMDKKTLSFIATISNEPVESFRCYTYQQSVPKHWNF